MASKQARSLAHAAINEAKASSDNGDDVFGRTAEQLILDCVDGASAKAQADAVVLVQEWLDNDAPGWIVAFYACLANCFVEADDAISAPTRAEPDRRVVWLHYDAGRGGRHGVAITGKGGAARYTVIDGRKRPLKSFDDAETAGREAADMLEEHTDKIRADGTSHHWRRSGGALR